jgi:hypothetical protein
MNPSIIIQKIIPQKSHLRNGQIDITHNTKLVRHNTADTTIIAIFSKKNLEMRMLMPMPIHPNKLIIIVTMLVSPLRINKTFQNIDKS